MNEKPRIWRATNRSRETEVIPPRSRYVLPDQGLREEPRSGAGMHPSSPWQKSCKSEKWGLPPIRRRHSPRNNVLSLKRIGWLYPIFRDLHFYHGLLGWSRNGGTHR